MATRTVADGPKSRRLEKVTAVDPVNISCGAIFSLVVNSATIAKAMKSRTLASDGLRWIRDQSSKATPNPDTQAT
jgi:hypothetical protein